MNEFERKLSESLKEVRDASRHAPDPRRFEARAGFLRRVRRRRVFVAAGSVAVAGATAALAFFAVDKIVLNNDRPASVAGQPTPAPSQSGSGTYIAVGERPLDVGIRSGVAWVSNSGSGTLSRIDTDTNRVVDTVVVGGTPGDIEIGDGVLWVADAGDGSVVEVDQRSGRVIGAPHKVGPNGSSIQMSLNGNTLWLVVGTSKLLRLNVTTGDLSDVTAVAGPADVAARAGAIWVLGSEGVSRLDPVTGAVTAGPFPAPSPGDIFVGVSSGFIANFGDDTVQRFNPQSRSAKALSVTGTFQVDGNYVDMADSGGALWVLSRSGSSGQVTPYDPQTVDPLADPVKLSGDPVEVSADPAGVWVVLKSAGRVVRIDPTRVLSAPTGK